MKIATTTGDFGFFCRNDEERIYELHRAGFRYIDLSMYSLSPDSVYMNEGWEEEAQKIKKVANELGMTFVQAHSPGGNPLSSDEAHVDFLLKSTIRSIEICANLGIKNTVVHNGRKEGITKEEWFKLNKEFYNKLLPTAEKYGVNVLCENSTSVNIEGYYYANSGKDMREFIEYVNHPNFHVCWDTGHANCEGSQYEEIMALGEHLYAIHYNDNHGKADEHILPYFGTLNHDEVINALLDVGYKGYFTLECDSSLRQPKCWLGDRRAFERDKRALVPPYFMQQDIEKLLYKTAKYLLEQYGLFEE